MVTRLAVDQSIDAPTTCEPYWSLLECQYVEDVRTAVSTSAQMLCHIALKDYIYSRAKLRQTAAAVPCAERRRPFRSRPPFNSLSRSNGVPFWPGMTILHDSW